MQNDEQIEKNYKLCKIKSNHMAKQLFYFFDKILFEAYRSTILLYGMTIKKTERKDFILHLSHHVMIPYHTMITPHYDTPWIITLDTHQPFSIPGRYLEKK